MALPKKKSRQIIVENESYFYVVSTGKPDKDWNFNLNLTVQDASGQGSLLKIEGLVTRDFWLDFPYATKKEDYPVLTSKDIAKVIMSGIKSGWKPKENGPPFIIKLDNNFITNEGDIESLES
ncbi:hypothetical protein BKI52_26240 [marine bacterium AO1-C]|nr:hypothetical protein BKI52_26240 [marine bacterium AO1-C]